MDARAVQAREHHRLAGQADRTAAQHREQRDRIIIQLAGEGWTYAAIAGAVGCSPELVNKVLRAAGRTRRGRRES